MYLNASSLRTVSSFPGLTITWDVFESNGIYGHRELEDCLTITWDVFEYEIVISSPVCSESLTITWDVFELS